MSKVHNIGLNLGQKKLADPFKTSRNITTPNPFKYSNFEGNSLPFADVFEGFEPKKTNKLKMIASSVAGSMNKLHSSITEPIVNFVNRMRSGISSAWDYAKNTNISEVPAIKSMNEILNKPIEMPSINGLSESISGIKGHISSKMNSFSDSAISFGKDMSSKWDSVISKLSHKKVSSQTPVLELESMLRSELESLEVVA